MKALVRLRRFRVTTAQVELTRAVQAEREAEQAHAAHQAALDQEGAGEPIAYAAWVPHALARHANVEADLRARTQARAAATDALATARLEERALHHLLEQRAHAGHRAERRREQRDLDDTKQSAARIRGGSEG